MTPARVAALALAVAIGIACDVPARAAAIPLPIALDEPTQRACTPPAANARQDTISLSPFRYVTLGDYPPGNDAVYFVPDTPYFHALWIDGLVRYFTEHGLTPAPGPLEAACIHPATREAGDVYASHDVAPGTYVMVLVVRRTPEVASLDGGLVSVASHAPGRAAPSARFFAQEIEVEADPAAKTVRVFGHLTLADETP